MEQMVHAITGADDIYRKPALSTSKLDCDVVKMSLICCNCKWTTA